MKNLAETLLAAMKASNDSNLVTAVDAFLKDVSEQLTTLESRGDALGEVNAGLVGNLMTEIDVVIK